MLSFFQSICIFICPAHGESYTAALSYTEGHNKSDIKTKKDGCGTARHFHNKYCHSSNPFVYLWPTHWESILHLWWLHAILKIFCGTEKYWQPQLFTNVNGMNRFMIYTVLKKRLQKTQIWLHLVIYYKLLIYIVLSNNFWKFWDFHRNVSAEWTLFAQHFRLLCQQFCWVALPCRCFTVKLCAEFWE